MRFLGVGCRGRLKASLFTFLILSLAVASAHSAPHKRLPTEEMEKYQDPPMYIFRLGTSARMVSPYGAFTSVQVNVDAAGHNITGDAANEPSIAVDPTNHNKMAIGWRQFNTIASNFRQAGYAYSSDGGTSWTFPGVLQSGVFRSDPVLDSDNNGRLFYLSLLNNFFDDMWRSFSGGMSWSRLAPADGGDKEWFRIDKSSSSGSGFQYQCWSTAGNNYAGRQFSRSTNGGVTWLNPVNIPNSPSWGMPDVDSFGNLYISGVNLNTNQIWCERSINARNAAVIPTFDQSTPINLGGDIASSEIINPVGLVGQVNLAADRSGPNTRNSVYMLASVQPTGFSTGSDVMFVRSTDFGHTFSVPVRVNDDPVDHAKWHWLGALSVAPNGRLDAVWLDTRNAPDNTNSQLFYSFSVNGGATWWPNYPVSLPFNPFLGYPNQNKMGDYISMVSDNAGADVAYTATFNGEEDIYYVRVAPLLSHLPVLSTRAPVSPGYGVVFTRFIITGTGPKQVIIRGLGPSLTGVGTTLADPTLQLQQGSTILDTNDNWKTRPDGSSQQAEVEATGLAPSNNLESAIVATLNPGVYFAFLQGNNENGVGQIEIYDLTPAGASRFTNISSRGFANTGTNILTGGFSVGAGNGAGIRVAVRALGPYLTSVGVPDALADPTLELYNGNGALIATNDNWKHNDQSGQSQEATVRRFFIQPPNDSESVIIATLPPGNYTAVVRGKNNTSGIAFVEVYNLP
jgi:hypothetical protein